MAGFPGSKSSVRAARRLKALISALCADHQLRAFTTWLDGYAAKSAHFQASDHLLLCFN